MTGHVLTSVDVERDIVRLCELCDLVVTEIKNRAITAAETDAEYRKVHAQAILKSEGTVAEREAHATLASADAYLARRIAEGLLLSAREAGQHYRAQLSAMQSVNSNLRASAGLG